MAFRNLKEKNKSLGDLKFEIDKLSVQIKNATPQSREKSDLKNERQALINKMKKVQKEKTIS